MYTYKKMTAIICIALPKITVINILVYFLLLVLFPLCVYCLSFTRLSLMYIAIFSDMKCNPQVLFIKSIQHDGQTRIYLFTLLPIVIMSTFMASEIKI